MGAKWVYDPPLNIASNADACLGVQADLSSTTRIGLNGDIISTSTVLAKPDPRMYSRYEHGDLVWLRY